VKSLWILSAQRRLEMQKTLDTLTQTSDYNTHNTRSHFSLWHTHF